MGALERGLGPLTNLGGPTAVTRQSPPTNASKLLHRILSFGGIRVVQNLTHSALRVSAFRVHSEQTGQGGDHSLGLLATTKYLTITKNICILTEYRIL